MTEASEEVFISALNVLPIGGMMIRTACGRTTSRITARAEPDKPGHRPTDGSAGSSHHDQERRVSDVVAALHLVVDVLDAWPRCGTQRNAVVHFINRPRAGANRIGST